MPYRPLISLQFLSIKLPKLDITDYVTFDIRLQSFSIRVSGFFHALVQIGMLCLFTAE